MTKKAPAKVWVGMGNAGYARDLTAQVEEPTEEQKDGMGWFHVSIRDKDDEAYRLRLHLAHITICATKGDMEGIKDELVKAGVLNRDEPEPLPESWGETDCPECDGLLPESCEVCLIAEASSTPCVLCGELPRYDTEKETVLPGFACTTKYRYPNVGARNEGGWCPHSHPPVDAKTWIEKNRQNVSSTQQRTPAEKVRRDLKHVMGHHDANTPQQALPSLVDAVENLLRITDAHSQHSHRVERALGKLLQWQREVKGKFNAVAQLVASLEAYRKGSPTAVERK